MLRDMKSSKHLKPGQKGTKRLVEQYGDALLCVRYRHDQARGVRLKTVELIVSEKELNPPPYKAEEIVLLAVPYAEKQLRERLKAAGGRWNPSERLWQVRFGEISHDGELVERIV